MNYWLFIDNNIIGPLGLKEIVNSKYFNSDLLLCPYEMDADSPSNWYFAKELVEFEPYLKSNVAVSESKELTAENVENWYKSKIKNNEFRDLMMGEAEFYENILIENNVLKEKLNIKDREIDEYKRKVLFLEEKISKIEEELDKTLDIIKRYEENLNFKNKEIDRLSLEIKEIKNKTDEKYKNELEKKDNEIKTLKEELDIFKNKPLQTDKEVIEAVKTDLSETIEQKTDNGIAIKEEKSIGTNVTIHKDEESLNLTKDNEIVEKEFLEVKEKKDDIQNVSFETKAEAIQNAEIVDSKDKEKTSEGNFGDPFIKPALELKVINIEETQIDDTNQSSVEEFGNLNLKSSPIEKDNSIFQVADIKLEVANVNMDVVDSKKLEVIKSKMENVANVESVNKINETDDKKQKEELKIKEDIKINNINQNKDDKKEQVIGISLQNKNIVGDALNNVYSKIDVVSNENIKTEFKNISDGKIEENIKLSPSEDKTPDIILNNESRKNNEIKKNTKPSQLALPKNKSKFKTPVLIFSAILFILIFAGSIIYILKSGSDVKEVSYSAKTTFPKNDITVQEQNKTSEEKTNDDINISKINENVVKAMNIVKSYDLGGGKGSIDRWFSNVFTAGGQAKEEWNATYLNKNLFVVQYRVLKYKTEPIVYLFEVDVENNKIVRGINNNAIELLSGKDIWKEKKSAKVVSKKKIAENIEKDDEMF